MKIKKKHKQTDLGLLPDDWEIKHLFDVAVIDPENLTAATSPKFMFNYISLEDVDEGVLRSWTEQVFETAPSRARRLVIENDVLVSTVRPNLRSHLLFSHKKGYWVCSTGFCVVRCIRQMANPYLVFSHFFERCVIRQVEALLTGSNYPAISNRDVRSIQIPLPPTLAEQNAIAEALSDADAWIESLEQLIAKKRQIKQGAMQELLTGKTRLPGFSGKWEVVKAGNIGRFQGGSGFPIRLQGTRSGDYPFFKVSDMNHLGNDTFMLTSNNYICESQRREIGATVFPPESIVFAKVGAAVFLERKKILKKFSCIDNNMAAFIADRNRADVRFLHYVLLNFKLGDLVSTTALPSLSGGVLGAIEMRLPSISEQAAIASVLADMDSEIDSLEAKLIKARQIKQGMMQELLTGRIRLVKPKEPT